MIALSPRLVAVMATAAIGTAGAIAPAAFARHGADDPVPHQHGGDDPSGHHHGGGDDPSPHR